MLWPLFVRNTMSEMFKRVWFTISVSKGVVCVLLNYTAQAVYRYYSVRKYPHNAMKHFRINLRQANTFCFLMRWRMAFINVAKTGHLLFCFIFMETICYKMLRYSVRIENESTKVFRNSQTLIDICLRADLI